MPILTDLSNPRNTPIDKPIHVDLSQAEVAMIIDALLQAELTLPLIDRRYRAMKAIDALREHQLSLANRLEDLMSDVVSELGKTTSLPREMGPGGPL